MVNLWRAAKYLPTGAGLALLLSFGGAYDPGQSRQNVLALRAQILALSQPYRLFEGRLADSAYAPVSEVPLEAWRAGLAQGKIHDIEEGLRSPRSADALLAAALKEFVVGRLERAVEYLQEAVRQAPRSARLHNDLSVVYLARGIAENDLSLLAKAYSSAQRATFLAPSLPEAAFNYALILERVFLYRSSKAAWRHYLSLDPDSPWAEEAKRHLSALNGQTALEAWNGWQPALLRAAQQQDQRQVDRVVRRFSQPARHYVEDHLLAAWGEAWIAGNTAVADTRFRAVAFIGESLRRLTGDGLIADAAITIQEAKGKQRDLLAKGHIAYKEGRKRYKNDETGEARRLFARAYSALAAAGSPFRHWAHFYGIVCERYDDPRAATLELEGLAQEARDASYGNLAGWIGWLSGLIYLEEAEPSRALESFEASLGHFRDTKEVDNQASIHTLVANSLDYLRESEKVWDSLMQALQGALEAPDRDRLSIIYGGAARLAGRNGGQDLAFAIQDEILDLVLTYGAPWEIAEAYSRRALLLQETGDYAGAAEVITRAREFGERIAEGEVRKRTLASISVREGAILRVLRPAEAVESLTRALEVYKDENFEFLLVDLYLERALARMALSDLAAAESDLDAGIVEYERQRERIEIGRRVSYFDRARTIFDEMVGLQVRISRFERAFEYAERSKARSLLDVILRARVTSRASAAGRSEAAPFRLTEVMARLPAKTVLLQYWVQDHRALVWALTRERLTLREIKADAVDLRNAIERFHIAIEERDQESFTALSRRIFSTLISPIAPAIPRGARLVIVPDQYLGTLPFAALTDPQSQRFLFEEHALSIAPSASTYLEALERAGRLRSSAAPQIVAFGDPAFDDDRFPDLPRLPAARREAVALGRQHPGSLVLVDREATIPRFLAEAGRFEIIQFSGHAVVDHKDPMHSLLLFAPSEGEDTGELSVKDLYQMRLQRTRLVVLAACRTGAGPLRLLEGNQDFARPFLATGSPAVLVSLWNVDDESAGEFMDEFYRGIFQENSDPVSALRAAQRAMIRSRDERLRNSRIWAAFVLIGG